jgi:hypothetical protein
MGLTYHFKFRASADTTAAELARFLGDVEVKAKRMGFSPTLVLNAPFDTADRVQFARRFTSGLLVEDPRLIGVALAENQTFRSHDLVTGSCRLAPRHGVVLVVTDERGMEFVFGFLRYPKIICDTARKEIMPTPGDSAWTFSEFIKTADARYRKIVRCFADGGFLETELDDFKVLSAPIGNN